MQGILDGYTATHAYGRLTKKADASGKRSQIAFGTKADATRNGSFTRFEQMVRMEKAMMERGTPVRHACLYWKDKPCTTDPLSSTESPSNESILQLQKPCRAKY